MYPYLSDGQRRSPDYQASPVFHKIADTPSGRVADLHKECLIWLLDHELTREAPAIQNDSPQEAVPKASVRPSQRKKADEIKRLEDKAGHRDAIDEDVKRLWQEHKNPKEVAKTIDVERLNPDTLAFYRPFHYHSTRPGALFPAPASDWGIYLWADKLLAYGGRMISRSRNIYSFTPDVIMALVAFEVFNHEFFHHIVECAATSLEVVSAGFGSPKRIFFDYTDKGYWHPSDLGVHPHDPLEEALANAYAYNSLSFISRIKAGYKTTAVKLYQELLKKRWRYDPPGYRHAKSYIDGAYVSGAAQLLAMLTHSADLDPSSAMLISRQVLLNGNSAFYMKPEVPTFIFGTPEAVEKFYELVPAPMETYTQLFWPTNTSKLDDAIQARKAAEAAAKKALAAKASA